MFRIFRRARNAALSREGIGRYWRYAFGEILLVVVGILLALQINNWNEERIEQKVIREYALNLSAAIDSDMKMLSPVEMQIRLSIRQSEELAKYLRNRAVEEINNAELFFLTTSSGYRPYAWNRAALEQLKTSGGLRQMRNMLLVQRISDYDALTQHLDQDYREDHESARAIWNLINTLVDRNYAHDGLDEITVWDDGFTTADMEKRLTKYHETEIYEKLVGLNRLLLSHDLTQYRRLANMSRDFAEGARPRPGIELPRLRQFAKEIQDLIDEEYR